MAFVGTVAVNAIGNAAGNLLNSLINAHPKDKVRFTRNRDLLMGALNGSRGDYLMLGVMSGRIIAPEDFVFGPLQTDGWTGSVKKGTKGSWATKVTADDAWSKYQQVQAAFAGATNTLATGTIPGSNSNPVGNPTQVPGQNGGLLPSGLSGVGTQLSGVLGGNVVWYLIAGGAVFVAAKYLKLLK
jgi:hypothetical protein